MKEKQTGAMRLPGRGDQANRKAESDQMSESKMGLMATEVDTEVAAEVVWDADDLIRRHRRLEAKLDAVSETELRRSLTDTVSRLESLLEELSGHILREHLDGLVADELRKRLRERDGRESIPLDQFLRDAGLTRAELDQG